MSWAAEHWRQLAFAAICVAIQLLPLLALRKTDEQLEREEKEDRDHE